MRCILLVMVNAMLLIAAPAISVLADASAAASEPPIAAPQPAPAEVALRHLIETIAQGEPDIAALSPDQAEHMRRIHTGLQARLQEVGVIKSMTLLVKNAGDQLVYAVTFEHGADQFLIGLNSDGLIDAFTYGPHLATPETTAQTNSNERSEIWSCYGTVTGLVISPEAIWMRNIYCAIGGGMSGGYSIGPSGAQKVASASRAPSSPTARPTPVPGVTMTLQFADAADTSKMQLGKHVRLHGDFHLTIKNRLTTLSATDAKVLYLDPFGR
jgi:hypothetical protein